jgi:hypothetical protein
LAVETRDLDYARKLVAVCELVEKRFYEKARGTDLVQRVGRYLASSRRALHWLPRVLYGVTISGSVHTRLFKFNAVRLFAINWLDRSVLPLFHEGNEDDGDSLEKRIDETEAFIAQLSLKTTERILELLDYRRVLGMTPIAYRVYLAYLTRYSSRDKRIRDVHLPTQVYQGSRLILSGELGSGKTTVVFASLYSFFRALDFSHDESVKLTLQFFANTLPEALRLMAAVELAADEGLLVPAVVVDDVGAFMSKYKTVPGLADSETRRLVSAFIEYYQVSREGVGCTVVVSAPNMAPKGIRDTADAIITGYSVKDRNVYTIWVETDNFLKPRYMPRDGSAPPLVEARVLRAATATVHPPLVLPSDVAGLLAQRKLAYRRQLLEEMLGILRKAGERESGKEEGEKGEEEPSKRKRRRA